MKTVKASFGNNDKLLYRVYSNSQGKWELLDEDFRKVQRAADDHRRKVKHILFDLCSTYKPLKMDINDCTVFEGGTRAEFYDLLKTLL